MSKKNTVNRLLYPFLVILIIALYGVFSSDNIFSQTVRETGTSTPTVMGATDTPPLPENPVWYEVYFTSPRIPFDDIYNGGIENVLIEKINQSKVSIDLAVYEFSLENVTQALIAAKNRGVKVRVVYDDEFADPDPQINELKGAGVPVVPDERSAFMHNKFFVFDGQCIWTGSFNISQNAAYRNNENALYFCSSEASENFTSEFEELFAGQFGASSPSNTPHPVYTVNGSTVENYFAPEDRVMEKVIAQVKSAQKYIHFMAFSFTDGDLGQAMIEKLMRNVDVAGIFESRGATSEYSECLFLLQGGADIFLDGNPRTFHHKVIIIDGQVVILGSFNFSQSADSENDENLLIIHDSSLAAAYENEFQKMKEMSYPTHGNSCRTND